MTTSSAAPIYHSPSHVILTAEWCGSGASATSGRDLEVAVGSEHCPNAASLPLLTSAREPEPGAWWVVVGAAGEKRQQMSFTPRPSLQIPSRSSNLRVCRRHLAQDDI